MHVSLWYVSCDGIHCKILEQINDTKVNYKTVQKRVIE